MVDRCPSKNVGGWLMEVIRQIIVRRSGFICPDVTASEFEMDAFDLGAAVSLHVVWSKSLALHLRQEGTHIPQSTFAETMQAFSPDTDANDR
jgi:hypothetical protein